MAVQRHSNVWRHNSYITRYLCVNCIMVVACCSMHKYCRPRGIIIVIAVSQSKKSAESGSQNCFCTDLDSLRCTEPLLTSSVVHLLSWCDVLFTNKQSSFNRKSLQKLHKKMLSLKVLKIELVPLFVWPTDIRKVMDDSWRFEIKVRYT